ncbi:hypothetical protein [Streptomyces lavendulae]|uniref:hypothetical protein n=1 Tax=Streptomyces lavendulae TaxID=1914 RepID=UPI0037FF39E8
MILLAFALAFDATTALQKALPNYTAAAQKQVEDSETARQKLSGLYDDSDKDLARCEDGVNELHSCGAAPSRIRGYTGTPELAKDKATGYAFPAAGVPLNQLSLAGTWTAAYEQFTAGPDARLALTYRARNANLVLAGEGTVTVLVDGKQTKTLRIHGAPTLYRLTDDGTARQAELELRLTPGLQAFAFTFG